MWKLTPGEKPHGPEVESYWSQAPQIEIYREDGTLLHAEGHSAFGNPPVLVQSIGRWIFWPNEVAVISLWVTELVREESNSEKEKKRNEMGRKIDLKWGTVACVCNSRYFGGWGREITNSRQLNKTLYQKKKNAQASVVQ